jgi:hypothetical protein
MAPLIQLAEREVFPSLERAPPAEIVGSEPMLEAALVGLDVIDVPVRRIGVGFPGGGTESGSAGEGGDRLAAVADEMIAGAGEGSSHRGAVNLMQDGIESRAFPVAGDKGPDSGLFCFARAPCAAGRTSGP